MLLIQLFRYSSLSLLCLINTFKTLSFLFSYCLHLSFCSLVAKLISLQAKDASTYETQCVASLASTASSSQLYNRIGRSNSLPTGSSPVLGKPLLETNDGNANTLHHVASSSLLSSTAHPLQSSSADLRLLSSKVVDKLKTSFDMFISTQPEGCINTKGALTPPPHSPYVIIITTLIIVIIINIIHLQIGRCWAGSSTSSCHACFTLLLPFPPRTIR